MARIIPERTVEAWTTAYIVRWFPTALLWAPTQADPVKWDAALGLPSRRYFVLEYKAVERVGLVAPFIPIPIRQLKDYAAAQKYLRPAVEADPKNVENVYPLALAYLSATPPVAPERSSEGSVRSGRSGLWALSARSALGRKDLPTR